MADPPQARPGECSDIATSAVPRVAQSPFHRSVLVRWTSRSPRDAPPALRTSWVRGRRRLVLLEHVGGEDIERWPLGARAILNGRVFPVIEHRGVPPAPGHSDWSFDVIGVQLRDRR